MPSQINRAGRAGLNNTTSEEQERLEKEQSQEARINALPRERHSYAPGLRF